MINENEHDFTKMMLETIRKSKSSLLIENEDAGASFSSDSSQVPTNSSATNNIPNNSTPPINNNQEDEEENNELTEEGKTEAEKIKQMVDPLVNTKTFKIYPENGNVDMSGDFQNAKINWKFSKNDGFFIDAENVNFTDNIKEMIDKLSAYYVNWQKEWAGKIGEYVKK
jgi:hypothetical protein